MQREPQVNRYWDTVFSGLVPVKPVQFIPKDDYWHLLDRLVVEVTADHGPYRAGEQIEIPRSEFVEVTRRTKFNTFVRTASIDKLALM